MQRSIYCGIDISKRGLIEAIALFDCSFGATGLKSWPSFTYRIIISFVSNRSKPFDQSNYIQQIAVAYIQ